MTLGGPNKPREITDGVVPGKIYPNHEAIDFIIIMKKISHCLLNGI